MNDRERLAHIFGVTLTRPAAPLVTAGATMMVPSVGWVLCTGVVLALLISKLRDDAAIERGLEEASGWGFPVDGYRAWLLAEQPAFDIELVSDISIEVIRGSIAAVDRGAVVEKRGDRVVRVVTRRVQLARGEVLLDVADRRLLFELRDRILAPLHTDAGIVAVRMGDHERLAALVPAASTTATAAFRDQALSAPPALQQLVVAATAHARPPSEAKHRDHHDHRVLIAHGELVSTGAGPVAIGGAGIALTPVLGPFALMLCGLALGVHHLGVRGRRGRVSEIIASVNTHGFPVIGYDDWSISGRPIFDIEFARACPRALPDQLLGTHPHRLTWIDDQLLRIETTPRLVPEDEAFAAFWGGDPTLFRLLVELLLAPLHARVGIVAVRMGGYVQRRA